MKTILLLSLTFASPSFADLAIKPGLWTIQSKMKKDGKEFDPQAQMKAAMAKMTPEKKKQMEEMMAKMGHGSTAFGFSDKGMQICYSGEMLKHEESFAHHHEEGCTTTTPTKSSTHVIMEFKCKSGAEGKTEWNVVDSTHYTGTMKMTGKGGNKTEVDYNGSFTSADCGKVKPLESVMNEKHSKK